MKALLLATALTMAALPAFAGGNHTPTPGPIVDPTPVPTPPPAPTQAANPVSINAPQARGGAARSDAKGIGIGTGGNATARGGNARATGGNAVGMGGAGGAGYGGTVNNTITSPDSIRYGGSYSIRNNPDLAALVASTANQCAKPAGGTTSFLGVGLGAMFTPESDRCNRRQDAAALVALGRPDAALALLQQTDEIRDAIQRADAARPPVPAPKPAYCTPKPRETAAERLMRQANC